MRIRWISLFSLLSIALAGCGASQGNTGDSSTSPPPRPRETDSLSTSSPAAPKQEDDMPKDPPLFPTDLDPQALTDSAKADLAQRLSIPATQIKTIETKEVVWPDSSFGCPQPGIAYAQIPTAGYLILLAYSGKEFEYHVDMRGNTFYCENPLPPVTGTSIIAPP